MTLKFFAGIKLLLRHLKFLSRWSIAFLIAVLKISFEDICKYKSLRFTIDFSTSHWIFLFCKISPFRCKFIELALKKSLFTKFRAIFIAVSWFWNIEAFRKLKCRFFAFIRCWYYFGCSCWSSICWLICCRCCFTCRGSQCCCRWLCCWTCNRRLKIPVGAKFHEISFCLFIQHRFFSMVVIVIIISWIFIFVEIWFFLVYVAILTMRTLRTLSIFVCFSCFTELGLANYKI